jgi:glycosyltransferase involved in cell wall biosynthesis
VVASSVGGIPELIHDGTDGVLLPPGDVAAWAEGVAALLGDPARARRIGAAARRRVQLNHGDALWFGRMRAVLA